MYHKLYSFYFEDEEKLTHLQWKSTNVLNLRKILGKFRDFFKLTLATWKEVLNLLFKDFYYLLGLNFFFKLELLLMRIFFLIKQTLVEITFKCYMNWLYIFIHLYKGFY